MPARMCWNKYGLPKPDIQMMVWDDLSWWQEAGAGGVPRGRCCPVNSPPWQRGARRLGGPSAPALPGLHWAPGPRLKPSAALSHSPEHLVPAVLVYQHTLLVNFITSACIPTAPRAICKEVDNFMRYSALKRFLCCIQVLIFMKTHL